jgi:dsRNA-specific ribonuclease
MDITKLEVKIGYKFFDKDLLRRALTTRDFAEKQQQQNQDCEHQEVLSTLGDAVWKLVLTHILIESGCETKGELTDKRKAFEKEDAQVQITQNLGIEQFIKMSNGEIKDKNKKNILEATFEALIGAIFIDAGYDETKKVVSKCFNFA